MSTAIAPSGRRRACCGPGALLLGTLALLAPAGRAGAQVPPAVATGLAYLSTRQQSDGAYSSPNPLATGYQTTARVAQTLLDVPAAAAQLAAARAFLAARPVTTVEERAQRLLVDPTSPDGQAILAVQNADGGFGSAAGFESNVLDTAFAVTALARAGFPIGIAAREVIAAGGRVLLSIDVPADGQTLDIGVDELVGTIEVRIAAGMPPAPTSPFFPVTAPNTDISIDPTSPLPLVPGATHHVELFSAAGATVALRIDYTAPSGNTAALTNARDHLHDARNADGGWGFRATDEDSRLYFTYWATQALGTLVDPSGFVLGRQLPGGGFAEAGGATIFDAAVGLATLALAGQDLQAVAPESIAFLESAQEANGSFEDDPYRTAWAIDALLGALPPPTTTTTTTTTTSTTTSTPTSSSSVPGTTSTSTTAPSTSSSSTTSASTSSTTSSTLPSSGRITLARTLREVNWTSVGLGDIGAGTGQLPITGVEGRVVAAFLYWHGFRRGRIYEVPTVVFDGVEVTGARLGDATTNCWGPGTSRAFRADVTHLVHGDGTYTISGLHPAGSADENNGVSLVVVFDDGNPDNDRDLVFFEGNDSTRVDAFPGEDAGWHTSLGDIDYAGGRVMAQVHVADGQAFRDDAVVFSTTQGTARIEDDTTLFDSKSVPAARGGRAPGLALWDVHTFDITAAFGSPGLHTLGIDAGHREDCLGLVVLVLDLEPRSAPCGNGRLDPGEECDGSAAEGDCVDGLVCQASCTCGCEDDDACDDLDACTDDVCSDGACSNPPSSPPPAGCATSSTTTTSTVSTTTTPSTTTTIASTTTSSISTTSTTTTSSSTSTTTVPTSTTSSSTSTTSSSTSTSSSMPSTTTTKSSTSTTTGTSTTLPPICDEAPTFTSIGCRLDALIAKVAASAVPEPTKASLLHALTAARERVRRAEDRFGAGSSRGAQAKLRSAERRLVSFGHRVRSLRGGQVIPEGVRVMLIGEALPIQEDVSILRRSL